MRLPLPISSYRTASRRTGSQRLVNAYAEVSPQPTGKSPVHVKRAPGIASWATVGVGPGRGLFVMGGVLYAVSGTSVYHITGGGTATRIGTIPGTDRVAKAHNGTQAVVITGTSGYAVSLTAVTPITDADFRPAGAVDFVDNFLVFVEANSGRFFCSDLADATSYDALNFATAEAAPDKLVSLIVTQRQILLLGEDTTEIWWNVGVSGFPFQRIGSGVLEKGCAAKQGVTKADNTAFWLANDRTIRALRGPTPQRISQHGVEQALRSYARVDDCQAFAWIVDGHECVAFRFPSAGACWVYDITTQEWHERESYAAGVWRPIDAAQAYGRTYVQDATTGAVGILDPDTYTEWGDVLVDRRTFQPVYNDNDDLFHTRLQLVCDTGVGLISGQGSQPDLRLQVSDDGGMTYDEVPSRTLGAIGNFRTQVDWWRLGRAQDRVYQTIYSDPTPLTFSDAQLELARA